MKTYKLTLKKIIFSMIYFVVIGSLITLSWVTYFSDSIGFARDDRTPVTYEIDNIDFILMSSEELQNKITHNFNKKIIGVARTECDENTKECSKVVRMLHMERKELFLKVCNHEVMHHVFSIPDVSKEEEYVAALDGYIKFPVCDELYNRTL